MVRFLEICDRDETERVYINLDKVCLVRRKSDGGSGHLLELEIEFVGGLRSNLVGDLGLKFVAALDKLGFADW